MRAEKSTRFFLRQKLQTLSVYLRSLFLFVGKYGASAPALYAIRNRLGNCSDCSCALQRLLRRGIFFSVKMIELKAFLLFSLLLFFSLSPPTHTKKNTHTHTHSLSDYHPHTDSRTFSIRVFFSFTRTRVKIFRTKKRGNEGRV